MQAFITAANLSAPDINGDSDHAQATSVSTTLSPLTLIFPCGNTSFFTAGAPHGMDPSMQSMLTMLLLLART